MHTYYVSGTVLDTGDRTVNGTEMLLLKSSPSFGRRQIINNNQINNVVCWKVRRAGEKSIKKGVIRKARRGFAALERRKACEERK